MRRKDKKRVRQHKFILEEQKDVVALYRQEYLDGIIRHIDVANLFDREFGMTYAITIKRRYNKGLNNVNVYPLHDLELVKNLLEALGVIYYVDDDRHIQLGSDVGGGIYDSQN